MKKVSRIITTAAVLGMAVVAAACSKSGGKGGSAAYNFTLWTGFGTDYTGQVDKVVAKFNEKHSDVSIKHVAKKDYDGLLTEVLNSVSTSTFPNFTCGYPDHFAEYWKKGIINPLDDYIKRYDEEHGGNIISDYYSQYMTENKTIGYDEDGTAFTLGLPFNKSTEVMLCNGYYFDFFKEKDPTITVPTTWAELETVAAKVNAVVASQNLEATTSNYIIGKVNGEGHAYDCRVSATSDPAAGEKVLQDISKLGLEKQFCVLGYDSADNAFITILHQWNVPYSSYSYDDYKNHDQFGKALFYNATNKNATKEAIDYFVGLNSAKAFGVPETFKESLYCTNALEQGRCLFTIGSSGGLNKPDFEGKRLDIYPILYKDAAHKAVISQGTSLGLLNQYTSEKTYEEEMYKAFSTMVELTTGELQASWVTTTGYFPASKSAYNDPTYQALLNNDNPTRLESLYRDAGKVNGETYASWDKFVDPGFVGSNSIRTSVATVLARVFAGEGSNAVLTEIWNSLDSRIK